MVREISSTSDLTMNDVDEIIRAVKRKEEAIEFLRERVRTLEAELSTARRSLSALEGTNNSSEIAESLRSSAKHAEAKTPSVVAKKKTAKPKAPNREPRLPSKRLCRNCRQPGHQARTCKAPTLASAALVSGRPLSQAIVSKDTPPRLVKPGDDNYPG